MKCSLGGVSIPPENENGYERWRWVVFFFNFSSKFGVHLDPIIPSIQENSI